MGTMKRKIRKIIYAAFSLAFVFGMSGCGEEKNGEGDATAAATAAEEMLEEASTEETLPIEISTQNLEYGQREEFKKLYDMISPVDNAESFEGTWRRTDVIKGCGGQIEVSNQDAEGFDFSGEFLYYLHSGIIAGRAYFVTPEIAIYEYNQEGFDTIETQEEADEPEYVVFEMTEEGFKVIASASSADLGFGMSVFADGTYVAGEPVYTNATVLEDNFTPEEQENIKAILGDAYDTYFKDVVEFGVLESTECTLEDGTNAIFYDAFIPTMGGYRFELLKCENGDLYFYSEAENVGWKTNVSGAIDYPVYTTAEE